MVDLNDIIAKDILDIHISTDTPLDNNPYPNAIKSNPTLVWTSHFQLGFLAK